MTVEAYPLQWPAGRRRIEGWRREQAKFDVSFTAARDGLIREVQLMCGGRHADPKLVISTNIQLRRDGLPLANQRQPDDVGVAVYFTRYSKQVSFACDRWLKVEHNMRAIQKTIEALRGIDRWGTGDMLEAAFAGFMALPAPSTPRAWHEVLGIPRESSDAAIRDAYRALRSRHHPDRGGDPAEFDAVQKAFDQAHPIKKD